MDIYYKNDINNNYLVIKSESEDFSTYFREEMIKRNKINNLLTTKVMQINGSKEYYYEINSKQSLEKYFIKQNFNINHIKEFIISLEQTVNNINEYFLDVNNIFLTKETIFIKPEECVFEFCYCPENNDNFIENLREIFQFIISRIDHSDTDLVYLAYDLQELTLTENFCIDSLVKRINEKKDRIENILVEENIESWDIEKELEHTISNEFNDYEKVEEPKETNKGKENIKNLIEKLKKFIISQIFVPKEKNDNSEENDLKNREIITFKDNPYIEKGETGELPDLELDRRLLGKNNNNGEKYIINNFPFIIGKMEENVDLILNEELISRMHAVISKNESDIYFIEDLNSKNGTYLNERRISPYKKLQIKTGDIITFANQVYEFV